MSATVCNRLKTARNREETFQSAETGCNTLQQNKSAKVLERQQNTDSGT